MRFGRSECGKYPIRSHEIWTLGDSGKVPTEATTNASIQREHPAYMAEMELRERALSEDEVGNPRPIRTLFGKYITRDYSIGANALWFVSDSENADKMRAPQRGANNRISHCGFSGG